MPVLNALRAFEAAARHESFAKAADELGVTAAAVSHQVKGLEDWLGSPLFIRHAQGLSLNETGHRVLPTLGAAFDSMGDAVQMMRGLTPQKHLTVAALPSVAQLWLAPQLPDLRKEFPDARLSIHALEELPNFRREPFDLAIFYRRNTPPRLAEKVVVEDIIFPVCTPALAAELSSPHDLARLPLLFDTTWTDDWPTWLAAAGASEISTEGGLGFSLFSMALQAAVGGAGVLMAHKALVTDALASGSIVTPFEVVAHTGSSLAIFYPSAATGIAVSIAEWLTKRMD